MKNILVTICARGGSKGIPGKNIKPINGRPLLWYTAEVAKAVAEKYGADIAVSTDSEEIKKVASECGLRTEYTRPDYLANDTCGKPEAIKDVLFYAEKKTGKEYDFVVDLDITSPIRTLEDVDACIEKISADETALTIFSVSPCRRNPYFNMVEEKGNGYYGVVLDGKYKSRQSSPRVYDINGSIYVYRRESLDCDNPRAVTARSLVYVMEHLCFDLDEPADFEYLSYLFETGKIKMGVGLETGPI